MSYRNHFAVDQANMDIRKLPFSCKVTEPFAGFGDSHCERFYLWSLPNHLLYLADATVQCNDIPEQSC